MALAARTGILRRSLLGLNDGASPHVHVAAHEVIQRHSLASRSSMVMQRLAFASQSSARRWHLAFALWFSTVMQLLVAIRLAVREGGQRLAFCFAILEAAAAFWLSSRRSTMNPRGPLLRLRLGTRFSAEAQGLTVIRLASSMVS